MIIIRKPQITLYTSEKTDTPANRSSAVEIGWLNKPWHA
jgi:hypothetical protein